jgi:phosphopentomutase
MRRFVFIVLDGAGVGALPDAADYGDRGSDTLGNLSRTIPLHLSFLRNLGLGNIVPLVGVPPVDEPLSLCGRLAPLSAGKDTTVGHWEHMGLVTSQPFPTYPDGFPEEIVSPFCERIGRGILGNRPVSGTAIIAELGQEHMLTGKPIVYTSADSVFQIAAHVEIVPLEQLYGWCRTARELLRGRHAVARVIARPFTGVAGEFVRTKDRRDFSLEPSGPLYLDLLQEAGVPALALGKISEIYAGRGIAAKIKVASNEENLALVSDLLRGRCAQAKFHEGLLMTNLVDFDMVWGHRNDVEGFARGLEAVDAILPDIVDALGPEDRLILTADHGVDPTTPGTDHSREYVPLLLYPRPVGTPGGVYEGMFADTGATVVEFLTGQEPTLHGEVITRLRPKRGWRRYTPVQTAPAGKGGLWPCRVGKDEAEEAVCWLEKDLGSAPEVAVVLGSGLVPTVSAVTLAEVPYRLVPNWPSGDVQGHAYKLSLVRWQGSRVALLWGRVHEYEGYDLSEVQLQVRSMALWGVEKLLIISASGAVSAALGVGDVAVVSEVLDFQYSEPGQAPIRLPATSGELLCAIGLSRSVHASLPGPQYETPAELAVLRDLGVSTVSMSPAGELRAAHDKGLETAVLAVVANAGDTTHDEVLIGTARAGRMLTAAIESVLKAWGMATQLY